MSLELTTNEPQSVQVSIEYKHGKVVAILTNSPLIDHFLCKVKMSLSEHTWSSYAFDLKVFFTTLEQPLEHIDRHSCLKFMELQYQAGFSSLTINRRLAAVSSLFYELNLLDHALYPQNPVAPLQINRTIRKQGNLSLYRRQPQRVPDVIAEKDLRTFFAVLPTWRDRTLILLMWMSCLRISEAVSIRFEDIECSNRSIRIRHGKGNVERTVYMDPFTFPTGCATSVTGSTSA